MAPQIVRIDGRSTGQHPAETVGAKAANLARMAALGLPVLPAFVLPIELCAGIIRNEAEARRALIDGLADGVRFLEQATTTAFFLPAGIAVAAMLMAGMVTLPGTFIGSFVLNLWIGYAAGHELDATNIAAAVIIGFGSMLQAGIGGTILRKVIGYPAPLDNPRDLLFFLLLTTVVCVTRRFP
jgi:hypothetical protein